MRIRKYKPRRDKEQWEKAHIPAVRKNGQKLTRKEMDDYKREVWSMTREYNTANGFADGTTDATATFLACAAVIAEDRGYRIPILESVKQALR